VRHSEAKEAVSPTPPQSCVVYNYRLAQA
jgi:hypothetical protein